MPSNVVTRVVVIPALCLVLASALAAQTTTATIEGTVTDASGAVIQGAEVTASSATLAAERRATTDARGVYRLTALPAGTYTITVTAAGLAASAATIELPLNRVVTFDVTLQVGGVQETIAVSTPALDPSTSATGTTITPREITELPVNGRNYLDLLQLVPGVAINRQVDPNSDRSNPVLGERSGNNNFLIDGQSNKDTVNGGPAQQFNQETIAEFEVLTSGYKAEFGQASGAVVNVITKSGGNTYSGVGSLFFRDDALDATNSLDQTRTEPLPLRRYDSSVALGGPMIRDKVFFFGSAEHISEDRQLDFKYPDTGNATVNSLLRTQEAPYDVPTELSETRAFIKFDERFGQHQLSQQVNFTDYGVRSFLPLSSANSLPSARNDTDTTRLLVGFGDTALLGDPSNPFVVTLRAAFRSEDSDTRPSQTDLTGSTTFNPFDAARCTATTCQLLGNLPIVGFGNIRTPNFLDQKYTEFNGNANKMMGSHDLKFGLNYLRTNVDGLDARLLQTQLFASTDDFERYGAGTAGPFLLASAGGLTPQNDEIHLRNNYMALFAQDDWRVRDNLTVNLGLRWDYDSEFEAKENFAPRLGVSWNVTPKTVVRGSFGIYYDQFRLGLARNVPAFGGTDHRNVQYLVLPRGLYGSPSLISSVALVSGLPGACFSNAIFGNLTDAQIAAAGTRCPLNAALPLVGVDRLNNVVAPGRPPVPANTVITADNVQNLTGLTPQQYADQASTAIGLPQGYFVFGPTGHLTNTIVPPQLRPTDIADGFDTPHTLGYNIGVERELSADMSFEADYFHRDIRNLLGQRNANIAFESRVLGRRFLPPFTAGPIITFGPFYEGQYDALILNVNKRYSRRFLLGASYTYAQATDNSLGITSNPSDSFIGTVPAVTEPATGRSNANGEFTRANGTLVQQAGTFLNGPDRDKGPSDMAIDHVFQANGMVELPYQIQFSGIFRAQSGFHFSQAPSAGVLVDPDGDASVNAIDVNAGRNAFTAPPFVNLDVRFAKRFNVTSGVRAQVLLEFFNVFNRQNPAAVGRRRDVALEPFGVATQVLPGREGQIGFRIEF
ncbi:MAG TPA: TonB-dependent receptor [Vicinamibacterales bacterium]|nr:TonB-dependent receptor [Vicinamibacterales bacterium]